MIVIPRLVHRSSAVLWYTTTFIEHRLPAHARLPTVRDVAVVYGGNLIGAIAEGLEVARVTRQHKSFRERDCEVLDRPEAAQLKVATVGTVSSAQVAGSVPDVEVVGLVVGSGWGSTVEVAARAVAATGVAVAAMGDVFLTVGSAAGGPSVTPS